MSAESTYLLDNASAKAGTRMDVLARLYDATTRRVLDSTGLARRLALPGGRRWRRQRGALDGGTCRSRGQRAVHRYRHAHHRRAAPRPRQPRSDPSRHRDRSAAGERLRPGARAAGADPRAGARTRAGAHGAALKTRRLAGHRGFRHGFDPAGRGRQSRRNAAADLRGRA